jgi:hypothetical protein
MPIFLTVLLVPFILPPFFEKKAAADRRGRFKDSFLPPTAEREAAR